MKKLIASLAVFLSLSALAQTGEVVFSGVEVTLPSPVLLKSGSATVLATNKENNCTYKLKLTSLDRPELPVRQKTLRASVLEASCEKHTYFVVSAQVDSDGYVVSPLWLVPTKPVIFEEPKKQEAAK